MADHKQPLYFRAGKGVLRILRIPVDLSFLHVDATLQVLTGLLRSLRRKKPKCLFCQHSRDVGLKPRPCRAAFKYAHFRIFHFIAPCTEIDRSGGKPLAICVQSERSLRPPLAQPFTALFVLGLGWGLALLGAWKLDLPQRAHMKWAQWRNTRPAATTVSTPEEQEETAATQHKRNERAATFLAEARALIKAGRESEARIQLMNAQKLASQDAEIFRELSLLELKVGRGDDALAATARALEIDPTNHETRLVYAELLAAAGAGEKALEALRLIQGQVQHFAPEQQGLFYLARAQAHIHEKEPVQAREALRSLEALEVVIAEHRYLAGRAYLAAGEPESAQRLFQGLLEELPDHAGSLIGLADVLVNNLRDFPRAEEMLQRAEAIDPDNLRLLRVRATLATRKGAPAEAKKMLERILDLYPRETLAKSQLAALHLATGDENHAMELAEELTQHPTAEARADGHLIMARVFFGKGLYDLCLRNTEKTLRFSGGRSEFAKLLAAESWHRKGDLERAEAETRELIEQFPEVSQAQDLLARIRLDRGELDAVKAEVELALREDADGVSVARLSELATRLYAKGRLGEARELYERILEREPDDPIAANNLALVLVEEGGDLDRALELSERLHQRYPSEAAVTDTLGWVLIHKGLKENGLQRIREAISLGPRDPYPRYHLGAALARNGDTDGARDALQKALELDPGFPRAAQARKLLHSLAP